MWLELELSRTASAQLAGTIGRVGGDRHTFTGLMEMIAVIERLIDEGSDHSSVV